MQNVIFLPFAIVLFFLFRMMFKRAVFYHAGRKEWITDIRWYHYAMYYALMAFFTGGLMIPFFPETVMQIGRFYDLHHGRKFITVSSENDKELWNLNTGLPDKEEIFKYEVLRSVTPAEMIDEIIPETIEYQHRLKQMWLDIGIYNAAQYDFDKEFEVHYDIDNKNYYILADGKKFADIEVKRTTFFRQSMRIYRSVKAGSLWISNDGKHTHMIQLVVQFAVKRLKYVTHNAMLKVGLHMSTFWR